MHLSLMRTSRTRRAAILRGTLGTLAVLLAVGTAAAAWAYWQLRASLPVLEGHLSAPALAAPVTIERDVQGVPTITGESRADVAWALGFLHAQERYFQMDGQRRTASGELSELVASGPPSAEARLEIAERYGLEFAEPSWLPEIIERYNLTPPPGA